MTIEEIVDVLSQDLLRFAIHISGDFHTGSDLYHDVLVKAIENPSTFDELNLLQIKAWFFKSIKNRYIDLCRRRKHERALYKQEDECYFEDDFILKVSLESLNDDEKRIISLKYHAGYKSNEIADLMNMNASTVRNRTASATAKLRKIYREDT